MSKQLTLDVLVREKLMEKGYPLHYYLRFLLIAIRGLKEIAFDFPVNIKHLRCPITDYNAVIVPSDFVDLVEVGCELDDKVLPFVIDDSLNELYKFSDTGKKIAYTREDDPEQLLLHQLYYYENKVNANGEYLGRNYGYIGHKSYGYKYIPERSEVQLGIDTGLTEVVLTYISDGISTSAANVVHPYAEDTLKNYIDWKWVQNRNQRTRSLGDVDRCRVEYFNSRRVLRGRMFGVGLPEIISAARRSFYAASKT